MSQDNQLFTPRRKATVSLDCSTSSAVRAVRAAETAYQQNIRIYNAGSVTVFVEGGDANTVATAPSGATGGGVPIPAGAVEAFGLKAGETHIAAITASSTATIYLTPGEGV